MNPNAFSFFHRFDLDGLAASIWTAQHDALSDPLSPQTAHKPDTAGEDEGSGGESSDDEFARELAREMAEAAPESVSAAQDAAELAAMRMGRGGQPAAVPAGTYLGSTRTASLVTWVRG